MAARSIKSQNPTDHSNVDARIGNAVVEVRFGVDAVGTLRTSLMRVAYTVSEDPALHGYTVLADSSIAVERVREEWQRASSVLRPEVQQRLTICMVSDQGMLGIPSDPASKTQQMLAGVIESQRGKAGGKRTDYCSSF